MNEPQKAIQTNGKKTPETSLSPLGMWTPSNTPIPRPTSLTTPNGISIDSRNFAQLRHKIPIGYNGMPHNYPKTTPLS